MSSHTLLPKVTVPFIQQQKGKTPIVCLTAYTTPMAQAMDPYVDLILVGDSVGNVVHGFNNTLQVTLDMMILHTQAVMRSAHHALVVLDLPFGTYQESPQQAFSSAVRALKETGCHAVKLEGGAEMADTIAFLTNRGIPVMAHIGLQPQSVQTLGGFKVQGKEEAIAKKIEEDAKAVTHAGAFCVVLEGIVEPLARSITASIDIPTIGIGASPACDGQILVIDDLLGIVAGKKPKFVKAYASLHTAIDEAISHYAQDVRDRTFPTLDHCYKGTAS